MSTRSGKAGGPAEDLDKLSQWMSKNKFDETTGAANKEVDAAVLQFETKVGTVPKRKPGDYTPEELSLLAKARRLVTTFLQAHEQESVGHLGEIIGILQQMKDDFAAHLEELETEEKGKVDEYNGMVESIKAALAESEKITMAKEMKAADNEKAKADAVELLAATKEGLDADTKFLLELREICASQDKEYAARTEMRQQEIKAVGEALGVLADDDAKDLASKTLGDGGHLSFVQLGRSARGAAAATGLERAGKTYAALAALARKGKFPRVLKAIDEMVVGLKKEQQEEVEHKDFCNKKFHELEITSMKKMEEKSGLEAKIADTKNKLEAEKDKIVQINSEIAEATVAIQSANVDRVKECQDFQTLVADQRAVQEVMLMALDKLEKFYGKSFLQTAPPEAAQTNTTAQKKGTPAEHVLSAHAVRNTETVMAASWKKSWGKSLATAKKAESAELPAVVRKREMAPNGHMPDLQAHKTAPASIPKPKTILAQATPKAKSALVQGRNLKADQTVAKSKSALVKGLNLWAKKTLPKSRIVQDLEVKNALVQGSQTPPGQFAPYKKHAGSGAVLAMLKSLIKEAQGIEKDAIADENAAVQEYSKFIDESQASREALFVELLSAQERKAEAEVQIGEDQKSVDLLTDDLADLSSEGAATHEACDFVLKNFDVRQTARAQEIEALGQAKAILSGAK